MIKFKLMLLGAAFFALAYFGTVAILKSLEDEFVVQAGDYDIETVEIYKPMYSRVVVLTEKKTGLVISVKDCIRHKLTLFPIENFLCNKDRRAI